MVLVYSLNSTKTEVPKPSPLNLDLKIKTQNPGLLASGSITFCRYLEVLQVADLIYTQACTRGLRFREYKLACIEFRVQPLLIFPAL